MESILLTTKYIEFYVLFGAALAMAGGLIITMLQAFIRGKVRESSAPASTAIQEPAS